MNEHVFIGIGMIVILGVLAQWTAWKLTMPSILMLLLFGILAGPVFGFLNPDEILGELLFPAVSLSVGIILFAGGLGLKLKNLGQGRGVMLNLISLGALATVIVAAPAAHFLLGLDWPLSILLASILIVSGPTVVIPLLRFIRPTGKVSSILRWEGILIDPVGATVAVLAFEAIKSGGAYATHIPNMVGGVLMTLLVGGVLGALAAFILMGLFSRDLVPNFLQTPIALILLLGMFMLSNTLVHESGLMGATVMGVVLANQKRINIEHIVEFKEQLGVLLLSVLFIVLSARVELADFAMIGWGGLVFFLVLILVARPLGVWLSTRKSDLTRKEKIFLGWMAPRGIVAMAVASLFALELSQEGYVEAEILVPITIMVVIGTVLVYSLTAGVLARRLDLVEKDPQGVLMVGAHRSARAIGKMLNSLGYTVVLVDTSHVSVRLAQRAGLNAIEDSIFSDGVLDQIPLGEIGYLLALTPDDEVNALAVLRFDDVFGKDHVYQLNPDTENVSPTVRQRFHGRYLFQCEVTYESLDIAISYGGELHTIKLETQEQIEAYQETHGEKEILMFIQEANEHLHVATCDSLITLKPGQTIISLLLPQKQSLQTFMEKLRPHKTERLPEQKISQEDL